MTKEDLYKLASETSRKVVENNLDLIREQIRSATHNEDGSAVSLKDLASVVAALSITLAPDISAAVTASMLVELGLVSLEDA
ncbi:MAG: hypothetical protein E7453_06185 [Ruminococcaceae bacterium]|nr:hypothetical protein [Oscillospiraceae bacterium]